MTARPRIDLTPSEIDALLEQRFAAVSASRVPRPPRSAPLPPGPRFPAVVQSLLLLGFRHRFVPWLHRTYGDVITLRLLPRGRRVVLFARPEHIKEIFAGEPEVFQAGRGNAVLGPLLGHRSVLLQDSSDHRRSRRLLMPAFHGQALRDYRAMVAELASAEAARWQPEVPFAMHERMSALTLEIILQVVFGVTDPARLDKLRPCVTRAVDVSPSRMIVGSLPVVQRLGPGPGRTHRRALPSAPGRRRRGTAGRRGSDGRRRTARPARDAPDGRARDHCERRVLGAARAGPGSAAAGALRTCGRHRCDHGRRRPAGGRVPGGPASAHRDRHGQPHPDEAVAGRRPGSSRRNHGGGLDPAGARVGALARGPRLLPRRPVSGEQPCPPTRGCRSGVEPVGAWGRGSP